MKLQTLLSLATSLQLIAPPFALEFAPAPGSPVNLVGVAAAVVTADVNLQGLPENVQAISGAPPMVGAAVSSVARWRFRNETRSEKPVSVTFLFREAAIYPVRPIEFFLPAADRPLPRDFPPMPKLAIDPGYPPTSIAEGTVVIEVDVDSAGVPRALREIGAPPNPLGQIALNAVRQWKFAPAIRNGRAVDGTAIVVITFPRPVV